MNSESSDMRGGFGSLAQQGFLTPFPARESRRGERETAQTWRKRPAQSDFFDTQRAARHCAGRLFASALCAAFARQAQRLEHFHNGQRHQAEQGHQTPLGGSESGHVEQPLQEGNQQHAQL